MNNSLLSTLLLISIFACTPKKNDPNQIHIFKDECRDYLTWMLPYVVSNDTHPASKPIKISPGITFEKARWITADKAYWTP